MKMKKSSLKKINKFNKKMGCLFFALLMMVSIATPAFAAVNVEGQGGTSATLGSDGHYIYSSSNQMWKISIYYARKDTTNTDKKLWDTGEWKQYGKTFYMYHPTAKRGTMGAINFNGFKNAIFMKCNKIEYLSKTNDITKFEDININFFETNHFYPNTKSPAIAFNGYSIDPVKDFFKLPSNWVALAKEAYKAAGYDNCTNPFGNTTFSIDGFTGSNVNKSMNSGKAQNGYVWSTATKDLTYNDGTKGVKTDYKGKQIYLHPKLDGNNVMSATAWMLVYEPVVRGEVNPFKLGGKTYNQVACTPTEWAILAENGIIELKNYRKHMLCYLGNSTYLEDSWCGVKARSSEFPTDVSNSKVYQEGGIGMTIFDPYNYVIKDYLCSLSAPKSVKTDTEFNITFTHKNNSKENKGNKKGAHEAPINVKYVWLASIKKGSTTYWFDLFNLRNKTLSISNALKDSSGSLVSSILSIFIILLF